MKSLIIIILVIISSINIKCNSMEGYNLLFEEVNPDGSFSMKVFYEEAYSFGPHMIKIFAEKPGEKPVLLFKDKIYNDGSNLRKSNVVINWMGNSAKIYLNGSEQKTIKLEVKRMDVEEYNVKTIN